MEPQMIRCPSVGCEMLSFCRIPVKYNANAKHQQLPKKHFVVCQNSLPFHREKGKNCSRKFVDMQKKDYSHFSRFYAFIGVVGRCSFTISNLAFARKNVAERISRKHQPSKENKLNCNC